MLAGWFKARAKRFGGDALDVYHAKAQELPFVAKIDGHHILALLPQRGLMGGPQFGPARVGHSLGPIRFKVAEIAIDRHRRGGRAPGGVALGVWRRPSRFPRALPRPACPRSRIMARSNSANTPSIWNIALPLGVVVSMPCW